MTGVQTCALPILEFDVSVSNYFDWPAAEPKLPLPMISFQIAPIPDDVEKNKKAIKLGGIQDATFEVKLGIPPKYGVRLPIAVDVKRDYAEYHSSYGFENGLLTARRSMKIVRTEVPYERRDDYASFRRTVEADQARRRLRPTRTTNMLTFFLVHRTKECSATMKP